jgi:iron complex outermembrane receptor protein
MRESLPAQRIRLQAGILPIAVSAIYFTTVVCSQEVDDDVVGELPATEVVDQGSIVSTERTRTYEAPVRYRAAIPAPVESEPLIIDDVIPAAAAESVNSTFLPSTGLDLLGISEPQDVVRYAPNQSATDSGSRSFGDVYSVRGLTNTIFFGAPSTTIYVDDVPFGETFTYAQDLGPIDNVEVLRGPHPTLVGRNVYGGLINVTTRRPTGAVEGSLNYGYGSFDSQELDGWVMGALPGDAGSFRFGGGYDSRDGYLVNPLTGKRVDHQESWGFDGAVYLNVAPGWEVGLIAGYAGQNDGAPRLTSLDRTTGFYTVTSDVAGEQHRVMDHQAIRIAHEGDSFRFLSVTSHRGFDLDPYTIDLDFTALPFGFTSLSQSQELWSQEFRFSDNDPDADWGWNAGLYGSTGRIEGVGLRGLSLSDSRTDLTVTNINQDLGGGFIVPLTIRSTSLSESAIALEQLTVHTIDEESFALFGGFDYRGFDSLTLRGGARLDRVQRSLVRDKSQTGEAVTETVTTSTVDPLPGFPPFPAPPVDVRTTITPLVSRQARIAMQEEWVHLTPNAGVDWQVHDDAVLYANTAYAFKPGGFSAYADDPAFASFDEEKAWTSELGLKSSGPSGKLNTNLVAFYSAVEDYQVERSFTATDFAVFNADEAEIYGVEFEMAYALTPTLDFLGSIGWTHARLTKYSDPVNGQNLDGVTAPFVPEFDAVAALDYHLDNGFFARLELLALGNVKFDDFNRSEFQEGAYALLNSAVGYRRDNWSVALYGRNLADREYYTNMNPEVRTGAPGLPREYGVRVGWEF